MRKTFVALWAGLACSALPTLAHAQADPLSFNLGLTSDYRFRGISQRRLDPAVQGGIDYVLPGGFYVGAWASTIRWIKDAGAIGGVDTGSANVELDVYGGYKGEIRKDLTYDVGVLQYAYPGNHLGNVPGAHDADTTEIYAALTYGVATVKYSHAVTRSRGSSASMAAGAAATSKPPPASISAPAFR